jgi:hypothetical protein
MPDNLYPDRLAEEADGSMATVGGGTGEVVDGGGAVSGRERSRTFLEYLLELLTQGARRAAGAAAAASRPAGRPTRQSIGGAARGISTSPVRASVSPARRAAAAGARRRSPRRDSPLRSARQPRGFESPGPGISDAGGSQHSQSRSPPRRGTQPGSPCAADGSPGSPGSPGALPSLSLSPPRSGQRPTAPGSHGVRAMEEPAAGMSPLRLRLVSPYLVGGGGGDGAVRSGHPVPPQSPLRSARARAADVMPPPQQFPPPK